MAATVTTGRCAFSFYTLETGKTVIPVVVLTPSSQPLNALSHIVDAVVGSVRVAPLKASPIRNTVSLADLVGEWHAGSAFSKMFLRQIHRRVRGQQQYVLQRPLSGGRQWQLYL